MTEELGPGIYEALVTESLRARLDALADATPATTEPSPAQRHRTGSRGT